MGRTISSSIDIDASPAQIWPVLIDFSAYPLWNPFMDRIGGTPVVGARLKVHLNNGKRGMTFKPVVLLAETGRELRWLGRLGPGGLFDGEQFFVLEPISTGGSRLTHGERFSGILVTPLLALMTDTEIGFDAFNTALKERVEARIGS